MTDVYVVHGWKLEKAALRKVMGDMKPEAYEANLRVVFSEKGADAYLGEVLAKLPQGETAMQVPELAADQVERLKKGAAAFGIEALRKDAPRLWVVAG
jgi:hypothetical protein